MSTKDHWQRVYQTKTTTQVSWYAPHLQESLRLITDVAPLRARIIDIGAGASTLVDDLLDLGYVHLTVLDISETALAVARARLASRAEQVKWLVADVTTATFEERSFELWHDRAVFHFLTKDVDRRAYVANVRHSVAPGGHVVMATFSLAGPAKCSGLDVVRYDAKGLSQEFGPDFELTSQLEATHTTPAGNEQSFLVCRFKKSGGPEA